MKKLFICVFVLTMLDAAATAIGIQLGYLEEANPLISSLADAQPFITCFGVCLVTGVLLLVLYILRNRIHWMGFAMSVVLFIKSAVVCIHIFFVYNAMRDGYFAITQQLFYSLLFFM
jgi:hypothetical protein